VPIEHLTHTPDCHKFKVIDAEGQDTGQRVLKTFIGRKNVDLGGGNFAPYVWDEPSQSIRYGNLECGFDVDGFQIIREYGSIETLIDDQRFELQYWRTQGGGSWRVLDLWQIGLTINQQDDQCIITRNLSDGEGNTLDIEFLFRPLETVKNTFRLHVVDADQYRIRFQNSGIAGVPFNPIFQTPYSGVYKLIFENIKFQWLGEETDIHSNYTIENQAGGKKLDIFIGDFDLPAGGDIVISPDQWGPTTIADADDGFETDDTSWADDSSGFIATGNHSSGILDAGLMWTVTDVDIPGATIDAGTKISLDINEYLQNGLDGVLKLIDDRTPGVWGAANRPSQLTKHPDTVDWDIAAEGVVDSPELNTWFQQRVDGDDVAAAFVSGDKVAVALENVTGVEDDYVYWTEGEGDFTIVFTPGGGPATSIPVIMHHLTKNIGV